MICGFQKVRGGGGEDLCLENIDYGILESEVLYSVRKVAKVDQCKITLRACALWRVKMEIHVVIVGISSSRRIKKYGVL